LVTIWTWHPRKLYDGGDSAPKRWVSRPGGGIPPSAHACRSSETVPPYGAPGRSPDQRHAAGPRTYVVRVAAQVGHAILLLNIILTTVVYSQDLYARTAKLRRRVQDEWAGRGKQPCY